MERAIKERLIGAALLVLAGVIVIPWLLDGRTTKTTTQRELLLPGSAADENETRVVTLDIPTQSEPMSPVRKSMRLDTRQIKEVPPTNAGAVATSPAQASTKQSQPTPSQATANSTRTQSNELVRESAQQTAVQQQPDLKNKTSSPASADQKPVRVASRSAPPATFSNPLPKSTQPDAASSAEAAKSGQGLWAVQVGSFASQDNAERLAERLRGKNYAAFVMRNVINGRVRFRVRVGPVQERAQADLLAVALKEDRQPAKVLSHP